MTPNEKIVVYSLFAAFVLGFGIPMTILVVRMFTQSRGWINQRGTTAGGDIVGRDKVTVADDDLYAWVGVKDTCPDCKTKGFWEGPSGGMSTNVYCTNADCRSAFNLTPISAKDGWCERIGKAPDRIYRQKATL